MAKFIKSILSLADKQFSVLSDMSEYRIVFIRHGQSEWNAKNQFCGWYDAKLTQQGRDEAKQAGEKLKELNVVFDKGYTSRLSRSIETLNIILKELGQESLHVERSWRLNERHYGNLTGMNKAEAVELFGAEKVAKWRRSFDTRPPKMLDVNPHFRHVMDGKRFDLQAHEVPLHESLRDTIERTLPYWNERIVPDVGKGKCIIVAAHGNSLRGIVKHIDDISDEGIKHLNLPTGVPFMYSLGKDFKALQAADDSSAVQFIADEARCAAAMDDLRNAKNETPDCSKPKKKK